MKRYQEHIIDIISKLDNYIYKLVIKEPIKDTINYGYTFSALFWSFFKGDHYEDRINTVLKKYRTQIKNVNKKMFSWEFNNYALLELKNKGFILEKDLIKSLNFKKGTKVTNWELLRILNDIKSKNSYSQRNKIKLNFLLNKIFTENGFIHDEINFRKKTYSFQYYFFSLALLLDLYIITKEKKILTKFLKAINFILNTLPENNYFIFLGRGQEQIFGYASLIYILNGAYFLTNRNKEILEKLYAVVTKLKKYQRNDGSFPLVLSEIEHRESTNASIKLYGWYLYNTIYDYIPFLGAFLCKTLNFSTKESVYFKKTFITNNFLQRKNFQKYEAFYNIPSNGKGYYNDELAMPFIYLKGSGNIITPFVGGDPVHFKFFNPKIIALPYGIIKKPNLCYFINILKSPWWYRYFYKNNKNENYYFFINHLKYKEVADGFRGSNKYIVHKRKFYFQEDSIIIEDKINLFKNIFLKIFLLNILINTKKDNIASFPKSIMINDCEYYIKINTNYYYILNLEEKIYPLGKTLNLKLLPKENKELYESKILIKLKQTNNNDFLK